MSRYKLLDVGVFDNQTGLAVAPGSNEWADYLNWRRTGNNVPDPMDAPPGVPLETRRDLARTALRDHERSALKTSVRVASADFSLSRDDLLILMLVGMSVQNGNALPDGFGWRDVTDTFVPLNANQLGNLLQKIAEKSFATRVRRWNRHDAIETSNNPESLDLGVTGP